MVSGQQTISQTTPLAGCLPRHARILALGGMYGGTMRFQTNVTVDAADANLVLLTLERNLRSISMEVVRSGNEIRAYGIGPSPRPINARNTSIFHAEAGEDGRTLLVGDVEFQASALMDGSAQEPAVRSKIENAVRVTQAEIAMSQTADAVVAASRSPVVAGMPVLGMAAAEPALREAPRSMAARHVQEKSAALPKDRAFAVSRANRPQLENAFADRPHAASAGEIQARSFDQPRPPRKGLGRVVRGAGRYPLVTAVAVLVLLLATYLFGRLQGSSSAEVAGSPGRVTEVVPPAMPPLEEQLQYGDPAPASKASSTISGQASATPAQIGGPPASKARRQMADLPVRNGVVPAMITHGEHRSDSSALLAPVRLGAQARASVASTPAVKPPTLPAIVAEVRPVPNDAALGDRLEQWAASMRSTDATQQASFYAGHLDRYFLKTDVSHDFVLRDKEDFLRRGKRVELFDLENVAVKDRTDSAARIRLVKHYVVLAGRAGPASEKMVRSELSLRKIDGTWEITGERDFK